MLQRQSGRQKRILGLLLTLILIVVALWSSRHSGPASSSILPSFNSATLGRFKSRLGSPKYAFTTFLTKSETLSYSEDDDESDWYFQMVRTLAFKLLHDPTTRSDPPIPFIVLVTPDYEPRKRRRLEAYGAEVRELELLEADWIQPAMPRWHSVMTKLRLFQMTEFEKILFLDADQMILRRLDNIFNEVNATSVRQNVKQIREDEAPLPEQYLLAGRPEFKTDYSHKVPPAEDNPSHKGYNTLNAGFLLLKPSMTLFDYYMSVLGIEGRFDSRFPEQNLLQYAHRQNGNMPWRHLDWHWNVNWGRFEDIDEGVRSFHSRFFLKDLGWGNKVEGRLARVWWGEANRARGYFIGTGVDRPTLDSTATFHYPEPVASIDGR